MFAFWDHFISPSKYKSIRHESYSYIGWISNLALPSSAKGSHFLTHPVAGWSCLFACMMLHNVAICQMGNLTMGYNDYIYDYITTQQRLPFHSTSVGIVTRLIWPKMAHLYTPQRWKRVAWGFWGSLSGKKANIVVKNQQLSSAFHFTPHRSGLWHGSYGQKWHIFTPDIFKVVKPPITHSVQVSKLHLWG